MRVVVTLLVLAACGGGSDDPADAQADECSFAFDCGAGEVCVGGECVPSPSCTSSDMCGPGAYCTGEGTCARNTVGSVCMVDAECGGQQCQFGYCGCEGDQFVAASIPPNIMIVLDRSTSMLFNLQNPQNPDGSDNVSKPDRWDATKPTIASIVSTYESQANFGLTTFPSGAGNCIPSSSAVVGLAPDNSAAISQALDQHTPVLPHSTPLRQMMQNVVDDLIFTPDATRDNYVLLFTDGEPNCKQQGATDEQNKDAIVAHAATLLQGAVPVSTYAVGFSSDVDQGFLDRVAAAGGTGQAYSALDAQTLLTALNDILIQTTSCTFTVGSGIESGNLIVVVDGVPVFEDGSDGWTLDGERLILNGVSCETLRQGTDKEVTFVTGCDVTID